MIGSVLDDHLQRRAAIGLNGGDFFMKLKNFTTLFCQLQNLFVFGFTQP